MFRVKNKDREFVVRTFKPTNPLFEIGWFLGGNAIENEIIGKDDCVLIIVFMRTGERLAFSIDDDGTIVLEDEREIELSELMSILLNSDLKRCNYL